MALLTVADVAKRLRVTPKTVYRWIDQLGLPAVKIGGVIRIDPDELDRYLNNTDS